MTVGLTEYGRLTRVLVKHARDAFVSQEQIARQWKALNFSAPPDFARALDEYDRFLDIVAKNGTEIGYLPPNASVTLDSIYTRDASIIGPHGIILCRMGKDKRSEEPRAQDEEIRRRAGPVAGSIGSPGKLEGGDLIWLDPRTVVIGRGSRTNHEGVRQLRELLGNSVEDVIEVPLPDYRGQHDVMHLMSLISPVDKDLLVVYPRLLPDVLRRTLEGRGYDFVEVPDAEFETMGTNVLALAPRDCVMLNGNPKTRAALERAGATVQGYDGVEISLKGGGGPTCLTRPLARAGDV
jgi:N-dimethylarginine dimethylaminohydrolase